MNIGIISDTHGYVAPNALKALQGVDHIIHAGDVGDPQVLEALEVVAPVITVRGNMDGGDWSRSLPPDDTFELGGKFFYLVHDLHTMDIDPVAAGVDVVVSGHTHQPEIHFRDGVLYFNPGSASHGRYGSPPSVGFINLSKKTITPKVMALA